MNALGPLKLTITLTDYLKSPLVDLRTPVVSYFESFCQPLVVEGDPLESFCHLLQAEGDSLTLTNLDSGDIRAMEHHVWDKDANQWLDDLMEDLSSLEHTVDVHDLVPGMTPEDWDPLIEDVLDQYDLDLL